MENNRVGLLSKVRQGASPLFAASVANGGKDVLLGLGRALRIPELPLICLITFANRFVIGLLSIVKSEQSGFTALIFVLLENDRAVDAPPQQHNGTSGTAKDHSHEVQGGVHPEENHTDLHRNDFDSLSGFFTSE